MRLTPPSLLELAALFAAALGCWLPWPWLSFPAAVGFALVLPGQRLIRSLAGLSDLPGGGWMGLTAAIVLLPVPLNLVWHFTNSRAVIFAAILAINVLCLCLPRGPGPARGPVADRATRRGLYSLTSWLAACTFLAYWLPEAGGQVRTRAAHDYIKHHAVLLSLERSPLPLNNYFYAPEFDTPYYYYEYHYYVPAAIRKLGGDRASIGLTFGVTSALLVAGFTACMFLLARGVLSTARGALFATACVTIIGGWDIVPVVLRMLGGYPPVIMLESWAAVPWRIPNVASRFVWCPQHAAALAALVLAAHWLPLAPKARWWLALAPLLCASIFGSSVYLAITFFAAVALYVMLELLLRREGRLRFVGAIAVIALLGAGLMAVQAWQYHEMSARFPGGLTTRWEHNPNAVLGRLVPPGPLANFLDAPWILLLEFGLPALAVLLVRRGFLANLAAHAGVRLLILASVVGGVALFAVRSDINPIDYSFRLALLPANVWMALSAAALLDGKLVRPSVVRFVRPLVIVGVLLGLPTGLYELPLMGVRAALLGEPQDADRAALHFLARQTPPATIVQADPRDRVNLPQLIDRRLGSTDPDNAHVRVFTPRDRERERRVYREVTRAFASAGSAEAFAILADLGVEYVLIGQIERQRFGALAQFGDPAYFEPVYRDSHACVYRLHPWPRQAPPASAPAP